MHDADANRFSIGEIDAMDARGSGPAIRSSVLSFSFFPSFLSFSFASCSILSSYVVLLRGRLVRLVVPYLSIYPSTLVLSCFVPLLPSLYGFHPSLRHTSRRCSLSLSLLTLVFALANALKFPQAHQLRALLLNWGLATFPTTCAYDDAFHTYALEWSDDFISLSPRDWRLAAWPPAVPASSLRGFTADSLARPRRLCCRRSAWSHREKDGADVSTLGVTFKCKTTGWVPSEIVSMLPEMESIDLGDVVEVT
ncbi:hypothetical protein FB451DRAFT_1407644 [Mycena latifolia]|nr:hypothetical protein FB451DRAFT_1407644 [Mycena latifolia]